MVSRKPFSPAAVFPRICDVGFQIGYRWPFEPPKSPEPTDSKVVHRGTT